MSASNPNVDTLSFSSADGSPDVVLLYGNLPGSLDGRRVRNRRLLLDAFLCVEGDPSIGIGVACPVEVAKPLHAHPIYPISILTLVGTEQQPTFTVYACDKSLVVGIVSFKRIDVPCRDSGKGVPSKASVSLPPLFLTKLSYLFQKRHTFERLSVCLNT